MLLECTSLRDKENLLLAYSWEVHGRFFFRTVTIQLFVGERLWNAAQDAFFFGAVVFLLPYVREKDRVCFEHGCAQQLAE